MWEVSMEFHEDGSVTETIVGEPPWEVSLNQEEALKSLELEGFTDVTNIEA